MLYMLKKLSKVSNQATTHMNQILTMQKSLLLFLILLLHSWPSSSAGKSENAKRNDDSKVKLFVFGDSYADTGNWNDVAYSWRSPYGMTYPGKPTERFSDGRVFTDFIASYLEIRSPIPFEQWSKLSSKEKYRTSRFGMNLAYGGTGVFNTDVSRPNISNQIDFLEHLIKQFKYYTTPDLNSSVALVSVGGNDYSNYIKHPTNLTLMEFTKSVVDQLTVDLKRINDLGVKKIAVIKMVPIGCVPAVTIFSGYTNCTQSLNEVALPHNMLLQQSVDLLNKKTKDSSFFTLDLYDAFLSSLQSGSRKNGSLLKPCCEGVTSKYGCGSMEGNVAKYTVCEEVKSAFFWDTVHPTQNGWYQVYMAIKPTLEKFLNTPTNVM